MNNIWGWAKGLGVVITGSGLIVISGNSAIAAMNQSTTLPENYNASSGEQSSNANYSMDNDKTQTKGKDTVEKKEIKTLVETIPTNEILIADCIITSQGMVCSLP
ncbi:MAG: hypothetical protein V7K38_14500 [Nostoc sp.]|uniref:hypothetical protein n=1 Tax=Nostoc sp. TaxID=1180 RepID=UPI002FF59CAE